MSRRVGACVLRNSRLEFTGSRREQMYPLTTGARGNWEAPDDVTCHGSQAR